MAIDTALKNKVSIEEQTSSKESPAFRHGVCQGFSRKVFVKDEKDNL